MLENKVLDSPPSCELFKNAIRAIFEAPGRTRTRNRFSNDSVSPEDSPEMLDPLIRNLSKAAVSLRTSSELKESAKPSKALSSPSNPEHFTEVFTPKFSTPNLQSSKSPSVYLTPASSSGYLSMSSPETSFDCSGISGTSRTSFAHPDFKNIKYVAPEKTSPYASIDFFSPPTRSLIENCCTQNYDCRSSNKKDTSEKSSVSLQPQPVNKLFSFNEGMYFDTHCHLDFLLNKAEFNGSFADFMKENQQEFPPSFGGCLAVFCNPSSFRWVSSWSKHLDGNVWCSFGCHPKRADQYDDLIENDLIKALGHPKVRALGEIGLDYSERNFCSESKQKDVFRRQLRIARKRQLPVVIHCRDAYEDCLEILSEELPKNYPIHLHCFTDTWNIASKFLTEFSNLYIGITNLVTFPSAVEVHEVAQKIPLHKLLLETDAPYFIPTPLSKTAKFAHPGMAIFVAEKIASLRGISLQEVVTHTRNNANWVYNV